MLINKNYFSKISVLNFLISLIPLTLIIGNLAVNINILLICFLGFAIYKFRLFNVDKKKYQYLVISFFLYLILITLFRNLPNLNDNVLYVEHIKKSFFFLKYLILFFIIFKTIEEGKLNIKFFFISAAFFSLIVGIDILIQIIFGKNLLGYTYNNYPSGFFGDEKIAGSYLQKFSLFFVFYISLFFKSSNKKFFFISLSFIFFFIIILYTFNRIPFFLYVLSIFLIFFFAKKIKLFILLAIICSLFFLYLHKNNEEFKGHINSFYGNAKQTIFVAPGLFYNGYPNKPIDFASGHLITFNSGVQNWKENKIFGGGLKTLRIKCKYIKYQTCQSHPHNYWIEILLDVGLVGFTLIFLIFLLSFLNFLKFYSSNNNFHLKLLSLPFFLIVFFEFFPLRSSGSFFTTWNSTIIFFVLPILINIEKVNFFKIKLQT